MQEHKKKNLFYAVFFVFFCTKADRGLYQSVFCFCHNSYKKYIYTMYIYSKSTKFAIFRCYLMVILWLSYGNPVVSYAESTLKDWQHLMQENRKVQRDQTATLFRRHEERQQKKPETGFRKGNKVEYSGLEPLTSTLPVLRSSQMS